MYVPLQVDPLTQFLSAMAELFWRFLAGLLNGMAAGYVSHLILDADTPRGIPLLSLKSEVEACASSFLGI
jgi:membrane-bound metal-dependent hydrolase YbcI (DUF457 family)